MWGQKPYMRPNERTRKCFRSLIFEVYFPVGIQYISEICRYCHIRIPQIDVKQGFIVMQCSSSFANCLLQICADPSVKSAIIFSVLSACSSFREQALWVPWQMFAELDSVGVQGGCLFDSFSPARSYSGRCVRCCSPCSLNGMLQSLRRAWETLRGWKLWGRTNVP